MLWPTSIRGVCPRNSRNCCKASRMPTEFTHSPRWYMSSPQYLMPVTCRADRQGAELEWVTKRQNVRLPSRAASCVIWLHRPAKKHKNKSEVYIWEAWGRGEWASVIVYQRPLNRTGPPQDDRTLDFRLLDVLSFIWSGRQHRVNRTGSLSSGRFNILMSIYICDR